MVFPMNIIILPFHLLQYTRISSLIVALSTTSNQTTIAQHTAREKGKIQERVFRELELRLLRQEAGLPKVELMGEKSINLKVENAANINFGTQVGTINAAVEVISKQGDSRMADAIQQLSDAVSRSSELQDQQETEALQVIAEIAK